MKRFLVRIGMLGVLCGICFRLAWAAPPTGCDAIDLDQGWSPEQSERFWFTSQGSRLMPYSWFLALEVADPSSQTLIRDRSNMDRYGYIWVPPSPRNLDGLPIGFVKDVANSKEEHPGEEHVGLTCAACHTGSLNIKGTLVKVQGGPAMAGLWLFLKETVAALKSVDTVPVKFDRFSKKVLHSENPAPQDVQNLRAQLKTKLDDLETRLAQNASKNPYGYGRVDAFGHIFTRVLAQDLNIPENAYPPYGPEIKAPVSYPFLWDTPQHDLVQWNGSAPNTKALGLGPLSRNVGEVLGVFGELDVKPGRKIPWLPFLNNLPKYRSSANLPNMVMLENLLAQLWSPSWPRNCYPLADAATLARGQKVYSEYCVSCHRILGDPERKSKDRKITAKLLPLPEIVTDPTMAMNFSNRKAKTGVLEDTPNLIRLDRFGAEASGFDILLAAVNGVLLGDYLHHEAPFKATGLDGDPEAELKEFMLALDAARTPRYKARPLNGIWATAPYLHNVSVPTLWDLLNPSQERPPVFYLGSREFDPKKVGLVTTEAPGTFRFDTSPQGNWRNGHEGPKFGTALTKSEKQDLLEFLKTL